MHERHIQKISREYFDILEIHKLPKNVVLYTLVCTKNTTQECRVIGVINPVWIKTRITKGSYTYVVTHSEHGEPKEVYFRPKTRKLSKIHDFVDRLRDSLNNSNIEISKISK